jgi:dinuclear metal center YbgI/SA1388 family protein
VLLKTVVDFLDETLRIASFASDSALNGLQVEGSGTVGAACCAVDACEESIRKTIRARADLLLTHHGLFWGTPQPVTGPLAVRMRLLLSHGISLYAAHLPLDCHPELGNNARLARILELRETAPFGEYRGVSIGLRGYLKRKMTLRGVAAKLRGAINARVNTLAFGGPKIRTLGIVSGGGSGLVQAAAEAGCDALLTGEGAHAAYHIARESRISLICAGHYATETPGVQALGEHLHHELGIPVRFIDVPTGL